MTPDEALREVVAAALPRVRRVLAASRNRNTRLGRASRAEVAAHLIYEVLAAEDEVLDRAR